MPDVDRKLGAYLHLARASGRRGQPMVRDKWLLLAGVTADEMSLDEISDYCRQRILLHNRQHLVRRWPTLRTALLDDRFQVYLRQLRRQCSPEKAEYLLQTLGIEMGRERESYFTDHEYAAALLGVSPEALALQLRQNAVGLVDDMPATDTVDADSDADGDDTSDDDIVDESEDQRDESLDLLADESLAASALRRPIAAWRWIVLTVVTSFLIGVVAYFALHR